MNKEAWIKKLVLEPHVEGGWFRETYQSDDEINGNSICTSIYFLLDEDNFSAYHKLTSDEIWYYHQGNPLHISIIDPNGEIKDVVLGSDIDKGEQLFYVVPKGYIFASYVEKGFSIVSCVVSPGFTYDDFKLYKRDELLELFPKHKDMIIKLTR